MTFPSEIDSDTLNYTSDNFTDTELSNIKEATTENPFKVDDPNADTVLTITPSENADIPVSKLTVESNAPAVSVVYYTSPTEKKTIEVSALLLNRIKHIYGIDSS